MTSTGIEEAFERHRSLLLALSYRLTGSIEDAEEAVQETFARALQQRPGRGDAAWKPWLIRVATNLSLDALRRRKRRTYPGPWLPSPLADSESEIVLGRALGGRARAPDPAAHYELGESATLALLVVLEALPPRQRAAFVLREAFGFSAREIGEVIEVSEGGARMLLHRARETMRSLRPPRHRALGSLQTETHDLVSRLLELLRRRDVEGLAAVLGKDVRLHTDSGGHVTALPQPMLGRRRVARLLAQVAGRRLPGSRTEVLDVNALPALWIEFAATERRQAPLALLACDLDAAGLISELFVIVHPHKLARLRSGRREDPGGRPRARGLLGRGSGHSGPRTSRMV